MMNVQVTDTTLRDSKFLGVTNNDVGLAEIARFLRRRGAMVLYVMCGFVALGILYWCVATPKYSSTAYVMLDQKTARFNDPITSSTDPTSDAANLESQISILSSDRLAEKVIKATDLLNDKLYFPDPNPVVAFILSLIPSSHADDDANYRMQVGIQAFEGSLSVKRVGLSYVLSVEFAHPDPKRAAFIVNTLVSEYEKELEVEKEESSRKAAEWLNVQLNELQRNVTEAEKELENFKSSQYYAAPSNNPVSTDQKTINDESVKNKETIERLEVAAERNKTIYDTFLQKYSEVLQSVYSAGKVDVISDGLVPYKPSAPKLIIVLAASIVGGIVVGLLAAYTVDSFDIKVRTAEEVEAATRIRCLGLIPKESGDVAGMVSNSPFSRFAETMRSIKVTADLKRIDETVKVLGITSSIQSEGKSTISLNLGVTMLQSGARVLLMDADLRAYGLTRRSAITADRGLLEILTGSIPFEDCIQRTAYGVDIIPAVITHPVAHSSEVISGNAMRRLLETLRKHYDYIIIDLPPLLPVQDARAISVLIDKFIFVAGWASSGVVLRKAMQISEIPESQFLGCVLNKVDQKSSRRFETNADVAYYYGELYGAALTAKTENLGAFGRMRNLASQMRRRILFR